MRLVREGDLFSAYRSTDGVTWALIGTDTISMAATVYVGLAVTSHNTSATATATFTNVTARAATTRRQSATRRIDHQPGGERSLHRTRDDDGHGVGER